MALLAATTLVVVAIVAVWNSVYLSPASFVDESKLPQLPDPANLDPVALPHFRYTHPRPPAPCAVDMARLRKENPGYLAKQSQKARQSDDNLKRHHVNGLSI